MSLENFPIFMGVETCLHETCSNVEAHHMHTFLETKISPHFYSDDKQVCVPRQYPTSGPLLVKSNSFDNSPFVVIINDKLFLPSIQSSTYKPTSLK